MKYILGSVTNKFENEKKTTYKLAMGYVSSNLAYYVSIELRVNH